ncbi:MAG: hypothetical protein ACE5HD_02170 [Acidobacteriota bacterium]
MKPVADARRAVAAARAAGAGLADAFHRCSHTRFCLDGPGDRFTEGSRLEDGLAIRAWLGRDRDAAWGFAASTDGEPVAKLAERAVWAARGGCGSSGAMPAEERPLPEAGRLPSTFDGELLRASQGELRRRVRRFRKATAVARRQGLPAAISIALTASVIETTLVTTSGTVLCARSTLAAVQVRFPTAFGLCRLEYASCRLSDLEPAPLVALLAAYPAPAGGMARVAVGDGPGSVTGDLVLAAPLVASLVGGVARRAAAAGAAVSWDSGAVLLDDPLRAWAPGTLPFDGEGQVPHRQVLAGPPGRVEGTAPLRLTPVRRSFKAPPAPALTNLILNGVPGGGPADRAHCLVLLEVAASHGSTVLARGVWQRRGRDDLPVLARLDQPLETWLDRQARAGSDPGRFFTGVAFATAPDLILKGVGLRPQP